MPSGPQGPGRQHSRWPAPPPCPTHLPPSGTCCSSLPLWASLSSPTSTFLCRTPQFVRGHLHKFSLDLEPGAEGPVLSLLQQRALGLRGGDSTHEEAARQNSDRVGSQAGTEGTGCIKLVVWGGERGRKNLRPRFPTGGPEKLSDLLKVTQQIKARAESDSFLLKRAELSPRQPSGSVDSGRGPALGDRRGPAWPGAAHLERGRGAQPGTPHSLLPPRPITRTTGMETPQALGRRDPKRAQPGAGSGDTVRVWGGGSEPRNQAAACSRELHVGSARGRVSGASTQTQSFRGRDSGPGARRAGVQARADG